MSGQPYPLGVSRLAGYLRNLEDAREGIARESKAVTEHQEKLDAHKQNQQAALKAVNEVMDEMDVRSTGNFGYEERRLWLLRELNRQAEQYGRDHP